MSDLIRREDAIKIMACEMYAEAQSQGYEVDSIEDFIPEAKAWMNDAPSADRPQEWIPCSERLPESRGYYICTCKDGSKYKRASAVKWSNGWQLTGARAYWIVLAWMPLPEPWKGADNE